VGVRSRVANLATRSGRFLEAGSGAPIVLLHAFPLNAEQWLPQLAGVMPGCRIVAPDFRGFAGSDPFAGLPAPAVSMETYASDVLELMSHLDIPRAIVCGLSMGGYVALALMRLAPARVAGLVLADTRAGADSHEARAARDRLIATAAAEGAAGVASVMVPKLLGETTRREQPDLADAVTRLITASGADGISAAIRAMKARPDSTPALASITCPTLVLCGADDVSTPPAESEAMHRAIRGSRLVILPDAGHLSNLEQPAAFNEALFAFVQAAGFHPTTPWPPPRAGGR
jgi:pimeloyl-ACP methyl ester carboxylesterase